MPFLCLLAVIISFNLVAQDLPQSETTRREELVKHTVLTISYNEDHEIPNWVSYSLTPASLRNCAGRSDSFRVDPKVSTGSATLDDYRGSGFDRGHLAPAGDMKFSDLAMKDSFYLSNMTPQTPHFNRGKWKTLENLVRAWVSRSEETRIVVGPIIEDQLPTIGPSHVSIPREHFKVLLLKAQGKWRALGFLMSSQTPFEDLRSYALSIDKIEEITGLDFFAFLPDSEENELESKLELKSWNFKATFEYLPCQ